MDIFAFVGMRSLQSISSSCSCFYKVEGGLSVVLRRKVPKMQAVCVLLVLVGVTLADPAVYFMEKFETGKGGVVLQASLVSEHSWHYSYVF